MVENYWHRVAWDHRSYTRLVPGSSDKTISYQMVATSFSSCKSKRNPWYKGIPCNLMVQTWVQKVLGKVINEQLLSKSKDCKTFSRIRPRSRTQPFPKVTHLPYPALWSFAVLCSIVRSLRGCHSPADSFLQSAMSFSSLGWCLEELR